MTPEEYGMKKLWVVPIPFKLISKSNEKQPGHFLSAKFRVFEESIAFLAISTCKRPMLEKGWVVVRPHFRNRVHPDFSNLPKGIFDALKKGGVFKDDKYVACTVVPAVYGDLDSSVEIWG